MGPTPKWVTAGPTPPMLRTLKRWSASLTAILRLSSQVDPVMIKTTGSSIVVALVLLGPPAPTLTTARTRPGERASAAAQATCATRIPPAAPTWSEPASWWRSPPPSWPSFWIKVALGIPDRMRRCTWGFLHEVLSWHIHMQTNLSCWAQLVLSKSISKACFPVNLFKYFCFLNLIKRGTIISPWFLWKQLVGHTKHTEWLSDGLSLHLSVNIWTWSHR